MKLHSDVITEADICRAVRYAEDTMGGTLFQHLTPVRSTVRRGAFEIRVTGDGAQTGRKQNTGYAGASGQYSAGYAAWGWLIAKLYDLDPAAIWGSPGRPIYADSQSFHAATSWAFDTDLDSPAERREATAGLRNNSPRS